MPHRIDLELTSARDDGTWTWRAAGARQPKGTLDGKLLYEGAKVGDVMRAEAEIEVDGITILSVVPPRQKEAVTGRLEIIGPPREPRPGVTTSLVPKGQRGPRRRDEGDEGRRGRGAPGRERFGPPGEGRERRPGGPPREGRPGEGDRRRREAPTGRGRDGEGRPAGPDGATRGRRPGGPGPERPGRRPTEPTAPARPAPKRLVPGTKHRDAVLAGLSPEHHPIAEQVLRGGIPAVRQAIASENEKAKAEGRPPVSGEPILAIAEELLPRLKTAAWRDRAEAAAAMVDEIGTRDLRSVVAGAEAVARDDETRLLASTLREALEKKLEGQRTAWVADIVSNLDEGRVVRALRVSARPPDPSMRFPADLALRLAEAAGAAMGPETPSDRWAALLEAVAVSPIRRSVKPAGLPAEPGEELLTAARQAAGRIPAIASLLGLPMPPPPGPLRTPPRGPQGRPPVRQRPSGPAPAGSRPIPPPPSPEAPAPGAPEVPAAGAVAAPEAAVTPATEAPPPPPAPEPAPPPSGPEATADAPEATHAEPPNPTGEGATEGPG